MEKNSFRFEMGGWAYTVIASDIDQALRKLNATSLTSDANILNIKMMREQMQPCNKSSYNCEVDK